MNTKQNLIFFIGLVLIVLVFWMHGYWTILKDGIFTGHSSLFSSSGTLNTNNGGPGLHVPGTAPIPVFPGGKCPAGYHKVGNQCVPNPL